MRIVQMKTNHIKNPLGFDIKKPVLSWVVMDTAAKVQQAAQVQIAVDTEFKNIVFDSDKKNAISSIGFTPEISLQPKKRYFWRVQVWADNGDTAISEPAWFETAKMETPWQARWITTNFDKEVHPLLRGKINIPSQIVSARAYICGLGVYEMEINGRKVGDEFLSPGFHAYDFWLQYQTYDITPYLKAGENAVGTMLGNGWYKGRFGFDGGYTELYGDRFALIGEFEIKLTDGSILHYYTDKNWKCSAGPVQFSGIYDGEVYDASKNPCGWSCAGFDDSAWNSVSEFELGYDKLTARYSLPVKVMERRKPAELIHTPAGETVLDFSQNMAGWVEFECDAPSGTELKLQYGEVLQDGNFYNENLRTAEAKFVYISDGKKAVVRPHFTYYGFRYVKLSGFAEKIDSSKFTACVIYSDIDQTGMIETSNPLVNKLFLNALWGQKSNFLDVPTDCPQRDERMGWTGDAQIFCGTASFNMSSAAFYTKFIQDLSYEQKWFGGSVPFVVPCIKPEVSKGYINLKDSHGSAAWGDAATVIPWTQYLFYGDNTLLEKQYPVMKDWADYIHSQDEKDGASHLWKVGFHFADWLALDNPDKQSPMGGTDPFFIASAYYYYSVVLTAKAAKVLGKDDEFHKYSLLADQIKTAIQKEYFTPTGRITINTQTALVVALFMNLAPEEHKERITASLKKKLKNNNMHLDTGFVGTPYLCRALSENGANDYAYTLLLNDDYPSWLNEIKLGATTIWERWDSLLPDGKISGTGMNSLNHYAYGSVVEWMYRNMCGLNPVEDCPGFKKAVIRPQPDQRLSFATLRYDSPSGPYKVCWRYNENGSLNYTIKIPFDAHATVLVPLSPNSAIYLNGELLHEVKRNGNDAEFEFGAGSYLITCSDGQYKR